ncbi:hypothetical protein FRC10_010141, partial [Ceratobasidium sp. 414]
VPGRLSRAAGATTATGTVKRATSRAGTGGGRRNRRVEHANWANVGCGAGGAGALGENGGSSDTWWDLGCGYILI